MRAFILATTVTFALGIAGGPQPQSKPQRQFDPYWKDVIEVVSWTGAILGGLFTAWRAILESRANRDQRKQELRFRQAQVGSELVEKSINEQLAWNAMLMLDHGKRDYKIGDGAPVTITTPEITKALRAERGEFTAKEIYIREAFDALFYHYSKFQQALTIKLVTFNDVKVPANYYIGVMARRPEVYEAYMREFGFDEALEFLDCFDAWKKRSTRPGTPS